MQHPFLDRNAEGVRWIEEGTWWYRAAFDRSEADDRLVLPLLDTVATMWLNRRLLGRHASASGPQSSTFASTSAITTNC
ncbi:glycosyl hydrolase 2 galactose-binding domain-containing protein [Streptomyces galbus]|uniref:Beta-mannosidase-like galactose-binding domain-containing protein n=1 Tax=Streptomyces galbus TaxID=33898 RepID=A0A4U5X208_STRGB|nr:hypothetical protein [Streptomyces galbus]TKT08041.1 hypothetical protein E4U92_18675 [Streptomyces galbus]GHD42374.1 hypothetical protein GCM10010335_45230 [Streptomyces galbus]